MFSFVLTAFFVLFNRHCHCELDFNCPFLILLRVIENKKIKTRSDVERLYWIDQHFVSLVHFADFDSKLIEKYHPNERKREDLNITRREHMHREGRGLHLTHRTRSLINSKGNNMGSEI